MIEHNLTLAWRQLVKYRLQSVVSIVSLAIGFACFALASMWIKYETTYDGFHRDADRMYFLVKDHSEWGKAGDILENVHTVFCDTVYKHCPEIVESALFERPYFQPKEGKMERYIACDSSFFDFFDIRLLVGDRGFLQRKGEIAITRQKAEEWWPGENPLGKELEDKYGKHFVVSAIVEGWDTHTNLTFAFLSGDSEVRMYPSSGGQYAVRLAPKADVKSINQRLDTLKINFFYWENGYRNHIGADEGFELIAAKELRHRLNYEQMEVQIHHIYLFALAGGMLILCGLLNYLTMFVNRLFIRQREIALRTVFGATGRNLTVQFLTEYGMVLLIAAYIGIIFMKWVLPDFRLLAGLPDGWGFFYRETFTSMFFVLVVSLLISLPVIQFFRRQALQNSIQVQVGLFSYSNFRKLSVCLQIGISIFFIFCTAVMMKQIDTLRHTDIGFDRENIGSLVVFTGTIMTDKDVEKHDERMEAAYSYLKQQPELAEVIKSLPIFPLRGQTATEIKKHALLTGAAINPDMVEDEYSFKTFTDADGALARFYNLRLLEGRFFEESDDDNAIILNESATRQFLWDSAVGKQIVFNEKKIYTIVGVVKDFQNYGPTTPAKPCFIRKDRNDGIIHSYLLFKYHPGTWETLKEKFAQHFKEVEIKYTLLNVEAEYENLLRSEKNLQLLLGVTAGTCVLIALFGVWSMIMLTCEQRRKEIAVRKVFGATVKDILDMFFGEYMLLQGVAALVAFPIGYACMKPWLEQYVVQTEISWWIYVGIFLLVALLVALCIGWRVWKTATARPADEICKG